jgi:lactoylglutathione lyase
VSGSLRDAFTILQTPDLARAVAFYVERLGFEERYRFPESGAAAFTVVGLGPFSLGLAEATDAAPAGRVALWLYADEVDVEIEALRAAGAAVAKEPADMEWGERMASVLDPDGNEVFIGQRLAP